MLAQAGHAIATSHNERVASTCVHVWHEWVLRSAHSNKVLAAMVKRMRCLLLTRSFNKWKEGVQEGRLHAQALSRVVKYWTNR